VTAAQGKQDGLITYCWIHRFEEQVHACFPQPRHATLKSSEFHGHTVSSLRDANEAWPLASPRLAKVQSHKSRDADTRHVAMRLVFIEEGSV
jgi:hypothetical protein